MQSYSFLFTAQEGLLILTADYVTFVLIGYAARRGLGTRIVRIVRI